MSHFHACKRAPNIIDIEPIANFLSAMNAMQGVNNVEGIASLTKQFTLLAVVAIIFYAKLRFPKPDKGIAEPSEIYWSW
jgi:hypothetical protein